MNFLKTIEKMKSFAIEHPYDDRKSIKPYQQCYRDIVITFYIVDDNETISFSAKRFIHPNERDEILKSIGCENFINVKSEQTQTGWFVTRYRDIKKIHGSQLVVVSTNQKKSAIKAHEMVLFGRPHPISGRSYHPQNIGGYGPARTQNQISTRDTKGE